MIRTIITLIGLFLIWVLFFSDFKKEQKILIASAALILSLLGLWLENNSPKPKLDIVKTTEIRSCGILVSHSYRSNFDIDLCIKNTAPDGHVKRLNFSIIASLCETPQSCNEHQRVQRDLSVELPANESRQIKQNLSFSDTPIDLQGVQWSIDIHSVQAIQ